MNLLDFFADLANPALAFLPKALIVSLMAAVVCGVIGTHVVLRGMAFIGDAVTHAVFPGVAAAFALQGSFLLGGAIAGAVLAVLLAVFAKNRQLREDSVIGTLLVTSFAIGLVVIAKVPGYTGSLQSFLFGSITGIPDSDVYIVLGVGLVVLAVAAAIHKELAAVSLDREFARAQGLPVTALDLVLYLTVTVAVVISIHTIGNILVLALLVIPAATARMLTHRLTVMMWLSPLLGAAAAFVGLYLSWSLDIPTGATIVIVAASYFLLAWLISSRSISRRNA